MWPAGRVDLEVQEILNLALLGTLENDCHFLGDQIHDLAGSYLYLDQSLGNQIPESVRNPLVGHDVQEAAGLNGMEVGSHDQFLLKWRMEEDCYGQDLQKKRRGEDCCGQVL